MSPRLDGSFPEGFVYAYMPDLHSHRRMSFLGFRLLQAELPGHDHRPRLGCRRVRRPTEAETWRKIEAKFARWQGEMERKHGGESN